MAEVTLINQDVITGGRVNVVRTGFWRGTLFIPAQDTWTGAFELYSHVTGSPSHSLRVNIRAVDGSRHPTGAVLDQLIIPKEDFTGSYTWLTGHSFNDVKLTSGVEYALTLECDGGGPSDWYDYYEKLLTLDTLYSYNNGSTWSINSLRAALKLYGDDYMFSPPVSSTEARGAVGRLIGVAENAIWFEDV